MKHATNSLGAGFAGAAFVIASSLAVTAVSSTEAATVIDKKIDVSVYPELSTEKMLHAIIQDLKQEQPDAYSIRDLTICPARNIKLRDGRPYSWAVNFALNARGTSGVYEGVTSYVIAFKEGRITLHASAAKFNKDNALDALIARAALKQFATCEYIANSRVQAALEAEALPAK